MSAARVVRREGSWLRAWPIRIGLALVAFSMALATVLAIGGQQPEARHGLLLAAAAVLLSVAAPCAPSGAIARQLPRFAAPGRRRIGWGAIVIGCLIAAVGGYSGYQRFDNLFSGGFLQYAIGLALVGAGLSLISDWRPADAPRHMAVALRAHPLEAACLAAVLALGVFLRLYQLGSFPPPLGFSIVDEAQMGMAGTNFLYHGAHYWQYPELVYGAALAIKLFGATMTAVRYPGVFAGIVLLFVFYPLARMLFSPPAALAGTALLAVSRLHIVYTRLVLPACVMMVYECIIFLLAMRAARGKGAYLDYAAMGVLTGLGLYSHASFRLVPILLVCWWIGWLVSERRRLGPLVRAHAPGWLLYLAISFIVALPYLGQVAHNPQMAFSERLTSIMPLVFARDTLSDPNQLLRANLASVLGYFVGPGDSGPAVNMPNTPMLDPITAALFLLGLGYALLHLRRGHYLLLILWLGLSVTTGAVLAIDVSGHRFIGGLPAVFLLACIPIEVMLSLIRGRPAWEDVALGALLIALIVAGRVNYLEYFVQEMHDPGVLATFSYSTTDAIQYFREYGAHRYNYLLAFFGFPQQGSDYGWLARTPAGRSAADLGDILPIHDPVPGGGANIYFGEPYPDRTLAQAVASLYAPATIRYGANPYHGTPYSAVSIDAATIRAQQGLEGPCAQPARCTISGRGGRFWRGSLYVPASGAYTLVARTADGAGAAIQIDGRPVAAPLQLTQGWYTLALATARPGVAMPRLSWSGPTVDGTVPLSYLRKTEAHGMLLQYLSMTTPIAPVAGAERVPFPFFLIPASQNNGRPPGTAPNIPYRALMIGALAPHHGGDYTMQLAVYGGSARVYLDGAPCASAEVGPDDLPRILPFTLHLSGARQVVQVQFSTDASDGENAGVGLFYRTASGATTFLPWQWFTPPGPAQPAGRWLR